MKATGIVRKVDNVGRLVLPRELRRTMKIDHADLEIFVEADKIVLQKYSPACVFCGSTQKVRFKQGKNYCDECAKAIMAMF